MKAGDALCLAFAVMGALLFLDETLPDWLRWMNLGNCFINTFAGLWRKPWEMKDFRSGGRRKMNINRHPLIKQTFDLIRAIEDCGASEKLTNAVNQAGDLMIAIDEHLDKYDQDKCNNCGMD